MKPLFATALFLLASLAPTFAEVIAPLPIVIATRAEAGASKYSVTTTGQPEQNLQTVQFRVTRADAESTTITVTLHTGKTKTVAQVTALMSSVFKKFLTAPVPNTVLGSLGSFEKGGEVDFVAESPQILRFDFRNPGEVPNSAQFSQADVATFLALLNKQ